VATRKPFKRVGDDPRTTGVTEPRERQRRKAPPGPTVPAWKAAGLEPHTPETEGED
jgi:hypothetical protein